MAARSQLIGALPEAATRAFGARSDVEGMVSRDGDVLIRLSSVRMEALAAGGRDLPDGPDVWAAPSMLIRMGLLADRQVLAANWDALSHVLVASPSGHGAEAVLEALVASLLARRSPAELGLIVLGRPHSVSDDLLHVLHVLEQPVDPDDEPAAQRIIRRLGDELERRLATRQTRCPNVVVVVPELGGLSPEQVSALGAVMLHGPRNGIRLLAASARRGVDLVRNCPLLSEFGTRLVLRAADEEESIALLGSVDATELGGGGHLLARIEGRVPFQVLGYRVASDRLAQLVTLIAEQASTTDWWVSQCTGQNEADSTGPTEQEACKPEALADEIHEPSSAVDPHLVIQPCNGGQADEVDPSSNGVNQRPPAPDVSTLDVQAELPLDLYTGSEAGEHRNGTSREMPEQHALTVSMNESTEFGGHTKSRGGSAISTVARARLQARFFGARELLYDGHLVWPPAGAPNEAAMELLVFLGVQDPSGVRADLLSDSLWQEDDDDDEDRSYRLRKRRYRLRRALKRFIPGWQGDPIARLDKQNPVYRLDPTIIESDVHCFLSLLEEARSLSRDEAIDAYEKALGLYRGDLLERPDVPSYRWLDDGPRVLDLRVKYATMHHRARRRLADLLATGCTDDELARAQELYVGLGETDALDHRLWEGLARLHGRRNDLLGLEATFRRLRSAMVELGDGDDPDRVRIPPALKQVFEEVRASLLAGRAE